MIRSGMGEVKIWDTTDGRAMLELPGEGFVAFSADGRRLAAPARGAALGLIPTQFVRVWDFTPSPLDVTLLRNKYPVFAVASDRSGQLLAASTSHGDITIWDRATRRALTKIEGEDVAVSGLDFSPDATQLAAALADGRIQIRDVKSGKLLHTLRGHTDAARRVKFDPTGARLISASFDGTVRLWDIASGKPLWQVDHTVLITDLALSSDGRHVALCGRTKVRVLNATSGEQVRELLLPSPGVSIALGSGVLAVGSSDGTIRLWEVPSARPEGFNGTWDERGQLQGHTRMVWGLTISGRVLASVGEDQTVRTWDLDARTQTATFTGHLARVRSIVGGDGWLATASIDGTVRLWNPKVMQP
jgi:WD40 repeat protein